MKPPDDTKVVSPENCRVGGNTKAHFDIVSECETTNLLQCMLHLHSSDQYMVTTTQTTW